MHLQPPLTSPARRKISQTLDPAGRPTTTLFICDYAAFAEPTDPAQMSRVLLYLLQRLFLIDSRRKKGFTLSRIARFKRSKSILPSVIFVGSCIMRARPSSCGFLDRGISGARNHKQGAPSVNRTSLPSLPLPSPGEKNSPGDIRGKSRIFQQSSRAPLAGQTKI